MARSNPLVKAEAALRKHALTYSGAVEEFPWGERAIKIQGKVFVFLSRGDHGLAMSVKLPVSATAALGFAFAEPTGYGLGRHGWVTAKFAQEDDVPTELLMEWIDESFRAVAPKRVVAELEAGEAEPAPAPKPRKKRPNSPR